MSDSNPPESRLLDQLTKELADEPVADIDFDALENKIVARAEMEQSRSRRRGMFAGGLALAAAAAVALFMGQSRSVPEPVASNPPLPAARVLSGSEVNGNSLSAADRVVAKDSAVHVAHAKHSEWTLAPGSEARALEVGQRVVVALAAGSLRAKVVPSKQPETFVVEVKDTRIAVHGTEFSVVLNNDGVAVEVLEGVVAVGPRGDQPRWFMNAGDKGSFALSGQTGSVERDKTAAAQPAETEPTANAGPSRRPAALPKAPPEAELRALSDRAASVATQCFIKHINLEAGVRITAKSQMTVTLSPSGRLGGVSFNPPLAPQVQACVQKRLASTRLRASQNGGKSARTVWLSP